MVGPSLDTLKPTTSTLKFLCSYGGKILPRYPDGKLRYLGGETRVLAVHRSISFAELSVKLSELCGTSVSLRCQLPTEDLDALVSITNDEDLANLIEEYDRESSFKIRAFFSPPKSIKMVSPPSSALVSSSSSYSASDSTPRSPRMSIAADRLFRQNIPPVEFQRANKNIALCSYHACGNPKQIYLIHNGNHWQ